MICQLVDPLKSVSVNSMLTLYKKTWVPLQYVSAILYLLKCEAINIFMLFTTNRIIYIAFFNLWFQFYSKLEIATTSCLQNAPLEALLSVLIEVTWSSSKDGILGQGGYPVPSHDSKASHRHRYSEQLHQSSNSHRLHNHHQVQLSTVEL